MTGLKRLLNRVLANGEELYGVSPLDAPAERSATPLPMLYQGGYLTIKRYDAMRDAYVLGIPNEEVRRGLSGLELTPPAPPGGSYTRSG